jgi:hypothetical protein
MVQPFDPNLPKDYDGLLRRLSFQTGHNPATYAGAYALDRVHPAKLQPDLVERYFQTSEVWLRFLAIAGESALTAGYDINRSLQDAISPAPSVRRQKGGTSTTETIAQSDVPLQDDMGLQVGDQVARENQQSRKRKRCEQESITTTQNKIDALRTDLARLEWEHKMQKICETASQGPLGQDSSGDSSSIALISSALCKLVACWYVSSIILQ